MLQAGCGYLSEEYKKFTNLLNEINGRPIIQTVTLNDILQKTNKLENVVKSGARGHLESLKVLRRNLTSSSKMIDQEKEMLHQMNRYITSGQTLRTTGRQQFISLTAYHDVTIMLGIIYLNKYAFVNYRPFGISLMTLLFNGPSLREFVKDLRNECNNSNNDDC